jgi:hypothetical protein
MGWRRPFLERLRERETGDNVLDGLDDFPPFEAPPNLNQLWLASIDVNNYQAGTRVLHTSFFGNMKPVQLRAALVEAARWTSRVVARPANGGKYFDRQATVLEDALILIPSLKAAEMLANAALDRIAKRLERARRQDLGLPFRLTGAALWDMARPFGAQEPEVHDTVPFFLTYAEAKALLRAVGNPPKRSWANLAEQLKRHTKKGGWRSRE